MFLRIAQEGSYKLLLIKGEFTEVELIKEWEMIIETNNKTTGFMSYNSYKSLLIGYAKLLAEYNVVKGQLMKLAFQVDDVIMSELKKKGYSVNVESSEAYAESLIACSNRSNHIITRLELKLNKLKRATESVKVESNPVTYEELMASLNVGLGFAVQENITLARYNEYQKILKKRQQNSKRNGST